MALRRKLAFYRRHIAVATALIAAGAAAAIVGSGQLAVLCVLLTIGAVPIWALASAANRQHTVLTSASPEQKGEWRRASEGKVKPLDIPWRSGPSGGGGF